MTDKDMEQAMQIILFAGDARLQCKDAYKLMLESNFVDANLKIKEAQKTITKAHAIQTKVIQDESRGVESAYSLLFAHAQDTLMTIYSEIQTARQITSVFEVYDQRIAALEDKIK